MVGVPLLKFIRITDYERRKTKDELNSELRITNRMKEAVIFLILAVVLGSCTGNGERRRNQAKNEILAVEKEFQQMVRDKGVKEAFLWFADEDATLIRGGKLITGKNKIREYFDHSSGAKLELFWKPDFVDVSSSGDLGYTYGKYT
mgnify:CR=1 FL=1